MTNPGYTTTEFWVTTVTALIGIVDQAFGWNIPPAIFAGVAALVASYVISRGLAKKNTTSPQIIVPPAPAPQIIVAPGAPRITLATDGQPPAIVGQPK